MSKENKTELFKNGTRSVLKSMAKKNDLDITFSATENPTGHIGSLNHPRLPSPGKDLSEEKRSLIRGCADIYALKIAHHDPEMHLRNIPDDPETIAAFEALEQARCDAIGMNSMSGVSKNITTVLEEKCKRNGYTDIEHHDDVNFPDALHIIARSELTNTPPPPAAEKVYEIWKNRIGKHLVEETFKKLKEKIDYQSEYASEAIKLLSHLKLKNF